MIGDLDGIFHTVHQEFIRGYVERICQGDQGLETHAFAPGFYTRDVRG